MKSKVEKAIGNNGNEVPDKQEKTVEDISIDDFRKLDLRVAKIKSVSRVPNTDKLMKLEIDDGDNVRFIVSGIAEHYEEQDLVGNSIILLANLKPAKIRGEVSYGMLLAAEEGGDLALLKTDKEMKPGSRIT
ncbi:MAG: methionine--tRNA ligase subunit beta [Thaumarchaeota archaeon]|nr:methionine--tRNA ligase subunit beta [Nitrososphaerota archaeon]